MTSSATFAKTATPNTPSVGYMRLFFSASGILSSVNESGVVATYGSGGGSGEVNTASNLGTGTDGLGLYSGKSVYDLQFKRIKAGTNVTITDQGNYLQISASLTAGTLDSLTDVTAPSPTSGQVLQWNGTAWVNATLTSIPTTLDSLTNVTCPSPSNGQVLQWNGTAWVNATVSGGSGETNTASNLGTGTGVYSTKVGVDLQFKSLVAGTNVTLDNTTNPDEIVINASGGGGGSSVSQYAASTTTNDECYVVATGAGITYSRTSDVGTFVIPSGVWMLSFSIRVPGTAVTASSFKIVHNQGNALQANGFSPMIQLFLDTASSTAAILTASPKATGNGLQTGSYLESLIGGITNGNSIRIRGTF